MRLMKSISLRSLVGAIGLVVALVTAVAVPSGFLLVGYLNTSETLAFKARLNANRIAQYIYTHDTMWQYQQIRLVEQIQLPRADEEPVQQKIFANGDSLVLKDGPPLPAPLVTRRAEIVVSGATLGYIDVAASFRKTLYRAGFAAILSSLLGFGMYLALRTFPLRVLDRTLNDLQGAQRSLSAQNEVLRINEAQFSNALKMARAGHWEYDVLNDRFTFNDNFYQVFHTTAEAVGGYTMASAEYARRFVHPDDAAAVGIAVKAAIETTDPNFRQEFEHRMIYADGTFGYIAVRIFIVKDEHGRTIRTYGVNQDVTERKRMELALADSQAKFHAALTNMSQGLCMFDADEKLVIFNSRFAEIYGLPLDRVTPGMTTRELMTLMFSVSKVTDTDAEGTLALQAECHSEQQGGIDRPAHERWPQHLDFTSANAGWWLRRHLRGHHRKDPGRGENQASGASRRAHGPAEPRRVL